MENNALFSHEVQNGFAVFTITNAGADYDPIEFIEITSLNFVYGMQLAGIEARQLFSDFLTDENRVAVNGGIDNKCFFHH